MRCPTNASAALPSGLMANWKPKPALLEQSNSVACAPSAIIPAAVVDDGNDSDVRRVVGNRDVELGAVGRVELRPPVKILEHGIGRR